MDSLLVNKINELTSGKTESNYELLVFIQHLRADTAQYQTVDLSTKIGERTECFALCLNTYKAGSSNAQGAYCPHIVVLRIRQNSVEYLDDLIVHGYNSFGGIQACPGTAYYNSTITDWKFICKVDGSSFIAIIGF